MSSYHTSFNYNGKNSAKDYGVIITSFEPDNGFTESFLSMDNVSDDYFDGTKKYNYGSKYNTQANIQITFIKHDGTDMKLNEFRSYARWLTGARVDSWLDMYNGDTLVYSFLGKFTNLEQYKMDGRTIGCRLTFSSVSPWAYSAPQEFDCSTSQHLNIDDNGELFKVEEDDKLGYDNGVLCPDTSDDGSYFNVTDDGVAYLDNAYRTEIYNQSDDLYTYIYLDVDYVNESGDGLFITNETLGEETILRGMQANENIKISAKQFVVSDLQKTLGDNFNFVWPRLQPGINKLTVDTSGKGVARFTYRYPMKVGDNTMDIGVYGGGAYCGDCGTIPSYDTVRWEDIVGVPTTLGGYGITDAYTTDEVDTKLENVDIEWSDIHSIPTTVEGYGITDAYTSSEIDSALSNVGVKWENIDNTPTTVEGYEISDAYTKNEVYTKTEVDDKIDNIEVSGGTGGGSVNIDEDELNSMLNDILG